MSKRFTDTSKWDKAWFRKLSPTLKCVWLFLCDRCDHAGVWEIDREAFNYFVGDDVSIEDVLTTFGERIELISDDKLVLKSFIEFQYGELNPDNRVHKSVMLRLDKIAPSKGLTRTLLGPKDKDKEKDKDKDKDKESENNFHFDAVWELYRNKVAKGEARKRFADQIKTQGDYHRFFTAVKNYVRFLGLEKNKFQQGKQLDVFIGQSSKTIKPWHDWVDPDPSVFADIQKTPIDFKAAKLNEEKAKGERQALANLRRTQEMLEAQNTASNNISRTALDETLQKFGANSLVDAVLKKSEGM